MVIQTERLLLRELTPGDYPALACILQDPEVMVAYEGSFTDEETRRWLDRQLARYEAYGHRHGLWAVVLRATGEMIGQCGLTLQPWKDQEVLEIGYLFRKDCWRQGYATEAALACKDYAFITLGAAEVCAIIRETNLASQGVARRCGMVPGDRWVKRYRGVDMPHIRFIVRRDQGEE